MGVKVHDSPSARSTFFWRKAHPRAHTGKSSFLGLRALRNLVRALASDYLSPEVHTDTRALHKPLCQEHAQAQFEYPVLGLSVSPLLSSCVLHELLDAFRAHFGWLNSQLCLSRPSGISVDILLLLVVLHLSTPNASF